MTEAVMQAAYLLERKAPPVVGRKAALGAQFPDLSDDVLKDVLCRAKQLSGGAYQAGLKFRMKEIADGQAILELLKSQYPGFPAGVYKLACQDGLHESMF